MAVHEEQYYPEREFGGYSRVDGTIAFYGRIQVLVRPEMTVLDVGCGRGAAADMLEKRPAERCRIIRGRCKKVIGIDVSEAGEQNNLIDEFRRIESDRWPVESASIDLLIADAVLEHLENPDAFFAECSRVVKPGGFVCFRTPNKWAYFAIASALIPNRLHSKVLSIIQPGRQERDVFPTFYRANTPRALQRLIRAHGFKGCVYRHIAEPNYFLFSAFLYGFAVHVHRWLPSIFWPATIIFARRIKDAR